MVIHTKEKAKLHVKAAPETKIKGRNVLVVERKPDNVKAAKAEKRNPADQRAAALKIKSARKEAGGKVTAVSRGGSVADRRKSVKEETEKSLQRENSAYAKRKQSLPQQKAKQDREKAIGRKTETTGLALSVGAKTALDQMEGGNEVYDSYMAARNLSRPVESAAEAGRRLYRTQAAKAKEQRIKKIQAGKKIGKKTVKDTSAKAAKETSKAAAKKAAKETAKGAAKTAAAAAGTAAGTAGTGPGGILIGAAAGEAAGIAIDRKDVKNSTRNRMIQLFVAKMWQEESQDSVAKALKDVALMRFSMLAKYIVRYVGMFLLILFELAALVALPIIAVIAII